MILYHGSNMTIERIDLDKSKPNKNFGMRVTESLDALYSSEAHAKLSDPAIGLYFQSAQYVYSFLKTELTTGKIV